jgi:hypothetical protein
MAVLISLKHCSELTRRAFDILKTHAEDEIGKVERIGRSVKSLEQASKSLRMGTTPELTACSLVRFQAGLRKTASCYQPGAVCSTENRVQTYDAEAALFGTSCRVMEGSVLASNR